RWWKAGARGEEPCDGSCKPSGIGKDLPRRRAAFEGEARKPERDVELAVADPRKVPVEEESVAAAQAEVVAPHVEVEQLRAVESRVLARLHESRECFIEPGAGAKARREHRFGVRRDVRPADDLAADRFELLDPVRRGSGVERLEGGENA